MNFKNPSAFILLPSALFFSAADACPEPVLSSVEGLVEGDADERRLNKYKSPRHSE
jgi:hypothetical protein